MKSEKILILYRDGNYKWKKLKKLTKDDMNKKEIKYLLIPSIKNPLLFYTILPDERLLSEKFHIQLTMDIANIDSVNDWDDVPTTVIIPAFIISELRAAFIIGFLIYIPFIIIDMVVASTLMSMGMMMLPPTTISMPFKILLFIMADGWNLIIGQLVQSFVL